VTIEAQLQFRRECDAPCSSPGSFPPDLVAASPSPSLEESPVPTIREVEGGGEIALMGGAGDRSHIYIVDLDDGRLRAVTQGETDEYFPFWAAGGDRLGYVRVGPFTDPGTGPPPINLVLADPDGSRATPISNPDSAATQHPSLGPDGKFIAFSATDDQSGGDIWVTNLAGKATRLSNEPGAEDEPRWSPDGRLIAYTRFAADSNREDIWVMNSDGTAGHRLTSADGYEYSPAWAPDGARIAFVQDGHIGLMNADGSEVVALTDGTKDSSPTWSPDGRSLAFVRDRQLLVMRLDGSELGRVDVDLGHFSDLAWRP
jgi:Tol biopolymer transport system component